VRAAVAYTRSYRESDAPFAVVISGSTPGDDPAATQQRIASLVAAGMTWWLESVGPWLGGSEAMLRRIRQGPPVAGTGRTG
jgi:hypothetical protein